MSVRDYGPLSLDPVPRSPPRMCRARIPRELQYAPPLPSEGNLPKRARGPRVPLTSSVNPTSGYLPSNPLLRSAMLPRNRTGISLLVGRRWSNGDVHLDSARIGKEED